MHSQSSDENKNQCRISETVETFFPVKKISLQIISLPSSKVDLLKTQKFLSLSTNRSYL